MKTRSSYRTLAWVLFFLVPLAAAQGREIRLDFNQVQGSNLALPGLDLSAGVLTGRGPLWARGVAGNAIYFNGDVAEAVVIPHHPLNDARESLAIGFWIYPEGHGDHRGIVWKGDRSASPERIQYKVNTRPEGKLEFSAKGAQGEWQQIFSDRELPPRQWTRVTITFLRGDCAIWFGGERVAKGPFQVERPGTAPLTELLSCPAPLVLGRMANRVGGAPAYPLQGALDDFFLSTAPLEAPPKSGAAPATDPLASLVLFEKTVPKAELRETPVFAGSAKGRGAWIVEVTDRAKPSRQLRIPGATDPQGRFRILLDDFGGALDLGETPVIQLRVFRMRFDDPVRLAGVALVAGEKRYAVELDPSAKGQVLTGFGACTYAARRFFTNAEERRVLFAPMLAEMREAGLTHFDFDFGNLSVLEPTNDNSDPRSMDMDKYRAQWRSRPEISNFVAFLKYVREEGFRFGVRCSSYAPWHVANDPATRAQTHQVDEIAETWVAFLRLLREEGLEPTHAVPVWEPSFHPDTVAAICAATQRLARQHGFLFPIVGPYVIATGGQSMEMTSMPDLYETGALYTRAYLKACGETAPVIGLEDYASGVPLVRPNLLRLWDEVIHPLEGGMPRELWMLEYGAPHGIGPWNFFPNRWHGPLSTYEGAFRLARDLHQLLDGGVSRFYFWKAWDSIGETEIVIPSSWGLVKGLRADEERRPQFYTARMFWKYMPPGSQRIGARSHGDLPVSAVQNGRRLIAVLSNPRRTPVAVDFSVPRAALGARGLLATTTEQTQFTEREIDSVSESGFALELPPRSVSTFVCRIGSPQAPYDRVSNPEKGPARAWLSESEWVSATTVKGATLPYAVGALDLAWRRDETWKGDYLVLDRTRFRHGLTVWGAGTMVFAVPPGAKRLEGRAGVDSASVGSGSAKFSIRLDQSVGLETPWMKAGDKGEAFQLPLEGVRTIKLIVESQGAPVCGDWVEAAFVME